MMRLARIATDPRWEHALHGDLIRAGRLTLDELGWLGLKAFIDHPPSNSPLREAFDGPLNEHTLGVAQIVHAIEVAIWNMRGLKSESEDWGPFPQIRIPGIESEPEATTDWSQLDTSTDIAEFASPEALAILRG